MIVLGVLLTVFVTLPVVVVMKAVADKRKRFPRRCCWTCRFYDWDYEALCFFCGCQNSKRCGCFTRSSEVCNKWEALE